MTQVVALTALALGVAIGALGPFGAEASPPPLVVEVDQKPRACSPDVERAYEIMRFARYSHSYWVDALGDGELDRFGGDRAWHQWWQDHYDEVLGALSSDCAPAETYPALTDLPGEWEKSGYPSR